MNDFVIDELKCIECPSYETSFTSNIRRSGVYGRGSGTNGLWFYGEALGVEEINMGLPFVGKSGEFLRLLLREVGINEDECFFTSSVRCLIPNNKNPKAEIIKKCMEKHALTDIPKTPPKLIVTLGNVPLKAVLNKQKITENRGQLFDSELFKCQVLPTFNPSAIIRDPKKYDTLKEDLIKAREFILDQSEAPPKLHKELINSKETFLEWMTLLSDKDIKDRYCDLETTGLIFYKDEIASISFCTEIDGEYYSIAFLTRLELTQPNNWWFADLQDEEIRSALQTVLLFPITFHNGLFDVKFLWKQGFNVNFKDDTIDQHVLIDENSPHSLKYLVSIYNKGNSLENKEKFKELDEYDVGEFYKAPPELLLDINTDDTFNGLILKDKFNKLLKVEKLDIFYNKLQMPAKRSLTRMSYRGIMMDRDRIREKSEQYRAKIKEREVELYDLAGQKFKYTSSSKELPRVLYKDLKLPVLKRTEKTGSPSTDKETLDQLSELHSVPKLIIELRHYKGMLQKYLDGNDLSEEIDPNLGMLSCLDSNDRIHGNFLSFGTISGRPSCTKPNLLNIPKDPDIRSLFVAPEGWKLLEFDYSQAELVLLAYLSQDPNFIHDINTTDFHTATAKGILHIEEVDDFTRRNAKGANFLKSYGGGAEKLSKTIQATENKLFKDKYGKLDKFEKTCVNKTAFVHDRMNIKKDFTTCNKLRNECYVCEADTWLKKWDQLYPLVPQYKNDQKRLWRENGFIEGIYGRKKRFPPAFTQEVESYYDRISVNFMCQNGVGDAINTALVDIDFIFDQLFGWSLQTIYGIPGIVLTVYDSILIECPDEIVEDVKDVVLEIMGCPLPKLGISLKTDVNISQRWGEKLKIEDIEDEAVYE